MQEPKKIGQGYKVFAVKNGKLYPPQAPNENKEETKIDDQWHEAYDNPIAGYSKEGYPYIKGRKGQKLALRSGWHLGEIPLAKQFFTHKNEETGYPGGEMPEDLVWALVDYDSSIDHSPEAHDRGYMRMRINPETGKPEEYRSDIWDHTRASFYYAPKEGFYKYRTNPDPTTDPWIITRNMRFNRFLSDEEVADILRSKGIEPPQRRGGNKTLTELGLGQYDEKRKEAEDLFGRKFGG